MLIKVIKDTNLIKDINDNSSIYKKIENGTKLIVLYKNLKSYYQIKRLDNDNNKYWYINKSDCKHISGKIIKNGDFMWCHGLKDRNSYLNVMKKIDKKIDIIYDIGSNVGQISLQMKEFFKPKTIYCFEPDSNNIKYAKEKHKNDKVFNYNEIGIYYGIQESFVYGRGDNSCGGYYLEDCVNDKTFGNFYKNSIKYDNKTFKLKTLESFDIPKPDLIKIDVEGSEYNIISNSIIFKNTPFLIVEWHFPNIDFKVFSNTNLPNHDIIHKENTDLGGTWVLKLK